MARDRHWDGWEERTKVKALQVVRRREIAGASNNQNASLSFRVIMATRDGFGGEGE